MIKSKFENAIEGGNASERNRVAIIGLGGMGKSQIALEYCYRNSSDYLYVFWVLSDSETSIHFSFRTIASLLNLPISNTDDPMTIVKKVNQWFRDARPWLLVFDNADDDSIRLSKYFPASNNGHILITSRNAVANLRASTINLDEIKMDADSSLELLMRRPIAPAIDVYPATLKLVGELGHLPLSVDLAGAYMEQTGQTPVAFLSNYKTRQRKYLDLENISEATGNQYTHTVMTVWKISLERLEKQSPLAVLLLCGLAFVYPDDIPVKLFEIALASELSQHGLQADDVIDLVTRLRLYSLVRYNIRSDRNESDPSRRTLSIHRLVQAILLLKMDDDGKTWWCQKIISALDQEIRVGKDVCDALRRRTMDAYTPHVHHVFAEFSPAPSEEITSLLVTTLIYSLRHAAYDGAETLGKLAVSNSEILNGPMHPDTAGSMNALASLYDNQGKYDDAKPLYVRALAICEKVLGPTHPCTATSLSNLALLYGNQSKYDDAESLCVQALLIQEEVLGLTHPDTVMSVNNLAGLYESQGKYDDAEPLCRGALTIREEVLGPKHLDTAMSVNNLAGLYYKQGKYDDAEPIEEQDGYRDGESGLESTRWKTR